MISRTEEIEKKIGGLFPGRKIAEGIRLELSFENFINVTPLHIFYKEMQKTPFFIGPKIRMLTDC